MNRPNLGLLLIVGSILSVLLSGCYMAKYKKSACYGNQTIKTTLDTIFANNGIKEKWRFISDLPFEDTSALRQLTFGINNFQAVLYVDTNCIIKHHDIVVTCTNTK